MAYSNITIAKDLSYDGWGYGEVEGEMLGYIVALLPKWYWSKGNTMILEVSGFCQMLWKP